MKLAYFNVTFGTPSIQAGGSVTLNLISSGADESFATTIVFPSGATVSGEVRDTFVTRMNDLGLNATPSGSNIMLVYFETEGDSASMSAQLSSGSSMGFTVSTQRTTLRRSTSMLDDFVARVNVAETARAAAEAALLVALNDDITVADSLAQFAGQLAAAQYELDQLRLEHAATTAERDAISAQVVSMSGLLAAAEGRADSARSAAGVATALSIVGVAAANKRAATPVGGAQGAMWRKVGDS